MSVNKRERPIIKGKDAERFLQREKENKERLKMMFGKLNPQDLEIGKQYQYEEKYYCAFEVTILDKNNIEEYRDDEYSFFEIEYRIDKIIFNTGRDFEIDEIFTCSGTTNPNLQHYVGWKFKPIGSMTDYVVDEKYYQN